MTYAKSRLRWLAARQKIQSEVEKLRRGLIAAFDGFDIEAELQAEYTQFAAPVLEALDESLADEATNTTNPAIPAKLAEEAKAIIQGYQAYLAGEREIIAFDSNPIVAPQQRGELRHRSDKLHA